MGQAILCNLIIIFCFGMLGFFLTDEFMDGDGLGARLIGFFAYGWIATYISGVCWILYIIIHFVTKFW